MKVKKVLGWPIWKFLWSYLTLRLIVFLGFGYLNLLGFTLIALLWINACVRIGFTTIRSWREKASLVRSIALSVSFVLVGVMTGYSVWFPLEMVGFDTLFTKIPEGLDSERLREKLVEIDDLAHPDIRVLDKIGKAIGDRRIVALGESHHLTAEYPTLKLALIKHLHENLGFDVLLFEAPPAPLELGLEAMRQNSDPLYGLHGVLWFWKKEEILSLFEYVLETWSSERPLQLVGFDRQNVLKPVKSNWYKTLCYLVSSAAMADSAAAREQAAQVWRWQEVMKMEKDKDPDGPLVVEAVAHFHILSDWFRDQVAATSPGEPERLRKLTIAAMVAEGITEDIIVPSMENRERFLSRDKRMAQNVINLCDGLFSNCRVIVWAHNVHLHKSPGRQEIPGFEFGYSDFRMTHGWEPLVPNLGQLLVQHFQDDLYVIGFTAADGHVGSFHWYMGRGSIRPLRRDSIESILRPAGCPAVFLDLNEVSDEIDPFPLYIGFQNIAWLKVRVREQYDGIVVLDRVSPANPVK